LSSAEVKKAARLVFEEFKKDQAVRKQGVYYNEPRGFPQLPIQVAEEAFHILALRNLIMRATDYSNKYQLTTFGKSIDAADIFEKTVDQTFLSEVAEIMDGELSRGCLGKSYEDAITSAFRILEVRVRNRINAGPDRYGIDLMDDAFNPDKGRLIFGETASERQAVHLLFRSAYMMLRNPPSHRYLEEFAGAEIVEVVMFVDFLLKVLAKASERAP
jgi:hypothetical protein